MQNKVEEEAVVFEGALQNAASTSSLGSHGSFLLNTSRFFNLLFILKLQVIYNL